MNVDRMRAVANLIELEDRFYYGRWTRGVDPENQNAISSAAGLSQCGTTGCVAGWAAHLAWREGVAVGDTIEQCATTYLGLEGREADELFYGRPFFNEGRNWLNVGAVEIAKFLRSVADGEVAL